MEAMTRRPFSPQRRNHSMHYLLPELPRRARGRGRRTRRRARRARGTGSRARARRRGRDDGGLDDLAQGIEDDVDEGAQRGVQVRLLREPAGQCLDIADQGHVVEVVADDGRHGAAGVADDLLHDVAQVVDDEVERRVARGDAAQQPVHGADDLGHDVGDAVEEGDEGGVEVQRGEGAVDNVHH